MLNPRPATPGIKPSQASPKEGMPLARLAALRRRAIEPADLDVARFGATLARW